MNFRFLFTLSILALLLGGCKPDFQFGEGPLDFDATRITFDSLFTTFESPTERVWVFNRNRDHLLIDRIYLEKGDQSDFSIIVNGITGNGVEAYELPGDDSLQIMIEYTSTLRDQYTTDRIVFELNGTTQYVDLEAYVMDAVFWQDTVLQGFQTFDPAKRHVIDGYVIVEEGAQLTLPAGTHLYFTPRMDENFNFISRLEVHGRLLSNGTWGNKVVMQQTRTGEDYEETAGQWRGIRFYREAVNSLLTHTVIKNAVIGVEVDSMNTGPVLAKVTMDRCEVRNMAAYGIAGLGFSPSLGSRPMILAKGCLFHNCSMGTAYFFGGGNYEFINCTFANYSIDFNRSSPQLGLTNYYEPLNLSYQMKARFTNCIIWGSEEDEVVIDTSAISNLWDVKFRWCTLRSTVPLAGNDNLFNSDPLFERPTAGEMASRSYRLREGSPANNTGTDVSLYEIVLDLDDQVWLPQYDRGAFQLRP